MKHQPNDTLTINIENVRKNAISALYFSGIAIIDNAIDEVKYTIIVRDEKDVRHIRWRGFVNRHEIARNENIGDMIESKIIDFEDISGNMTIEFKYEIDGQDYIFSEGRSSQISDGFLTLVQTSFVDRGVLAGNFGFMVFSN